jgi:Type IV secretion system pilin
MAIGAIAPGGSEVNGRRLIPHLLAAMATTAVLLVVVPAPTYAASDLSQVIDSVRNWVSGLLAGLATLFLMVGGLRYLVAAGNRREMERGKEAMKSAVVGYVLAVMAPLLIDLLRRMVGI